MTNTNKTVTMKVTAQEQELLEAIRNYVKSYPNGHPRLLEYAVDIFDRLTDAPQ